MDGVELAHLRDGTSVVIRPIEPVDKALLVEGLERLSRASIERRFLAPKTRFSARELRYLTEVDGVNHVALVAINAANPSELVAVGRFVCLPDDPSTADIAVVVGDCYQGLRLGTRLGRLLADAARERGIRRLSATMRADNEPAHRLFATISGHLVEDSQGYGVHDMLGDLAA